MNLPRARIWLGPCLGLAVACSKPLLPPQRAEAAPAPHSAASPVTAPDASAALVLEAPTKPTAAEPPAPEPAALSPERTGGLQRGEVVVGVLGAPLHLGPKRAPAPARLQANVALVLEVREPWVKVVAGSGAVGWLEAPRYRSCTAPVLPRAGHTAVSIQDAAWQETMLFDGPAQQLFLRPADDEWTEASEFRIRCQHPDAGLGQLVAPFVSDVWTAAQALAVAQEREGITACAPAKQTVRSQAEPALQHVAALYSCQSPSGPQHLLAFGAAQAPHSAHVISLTRATLTRAEEVDLDGDGTQEWALELSAAGAELDRRDVWIVNADGTRVVFRTLGYSDETSASVRSGWAARTGTGVWAATLTAGRTRCVQLTWADGALHEAIADAAFCGCAARQLKAKPRGADDSVDLRGCLAR